MSHAVFQFAEFTIDPAARELWHGAERIPLPPKSFECLAYLLENRERAVGRDELISAVWGRIDVSDAVLAQTLLRARRAVGDTGAEQTTIRTVPRFGYRWIAGVQTVQLENAGAPRDVDISTPPEPVAQPDIPADVDHPAAHQPAHLAQPEQAATAATRMPPPIARDRPRKRIPMIVVVVTVVLLAIALTVAYLHERQAQAPKTPASANKAIAVMPVAVSGGDSESSWIRLGAMDYIAARLHEDGKLPVLPSSQIVAVIGMLRGDDAAAHVAQATSAKWLIQPQAQHSAKGWRIRLIAHGAGVTREASATAATPLDAAEQATERLLSALDIPHAAPNSGKTAPGPLTERVQRVDAALLAGDVKQAQNLIETAPAEQRAEPALRVREGQLEFRLGHLDEAERIFAPIASTTAPLPVEVQSQAMMGLGAVAVRSGDFPLAEKRYAEALASLGDNGDPNLVGNAYNGRGVARGAQGEYDLALSDLGRARIARERAGNVLDAASVDVNLANIENARHRYAQAIAHFDGAIAVHERFGVKDDLAADLLGKARAQLQLLDAVGALASSTRAFELVNGMENHYLVRAAGLQHAQCLLAVGRLHEAKTVLDGLPPAGSGEIDEQSRLLAAQIALASGDSRHALDLLSGPVQGAAAKHLDLLPAFVAAALLEKQPELAGKILATIGTEPTAAEDRMALDLARARLAAARNDATNAEKKYTAALALADADGVPVERARIGSDYARFLIEQRQLDKASAIVGDLAAYVDRDFDVAAVTVALYRALGDTALENAAREKAKPVVGERSL